MDKFDKLLVRVGMPPHLKGYRCTKEALRLLQENPDYIDYLTKGLYPAVGESWAQLVPEWSGHFATGSRLCLIESPRSWRKRCFGTRYRV